MMPINRGRIRCRSLLHPQWVFLVVISANEDDGFHSRFSYYLCRRIRATHVSDRINVRSPQKCEDQESLSCCSLVSQGL